MIALLEAFHAVNSFQSRLVTKLYFPETTFSRTPQQYLSEIDSCEEACAEHTHSNMTNDKNSRQSDNMRLGHQTVAKRSGSWLPPQLPSNMSHKDQLGTDVLRERMKVTGQVQACLDFSRICHYFLASCS